MIGEKGGVEWPVKRGERVFSWSERGNERRGWAGRGGPRQEVDRLKMAA